MQIISDFKTKLNKLLRNRIRYSTHERRIHNIVDSKMTMLHVADKIATQTK